MKAVDGDPVSSKWMSNGEERGGIGRSEEPCSKVDSLVGCRRDTTARPRRSELTKLRRDSDGFSPEVSASSPLDG